MPAPTIPSGSARAKRARRTGAGGSGCFGWGTPLRERLAQVQGFHDLARQLDDAERRPAPARLTLLVRRVGDERLPADLHDVPQVVRDPMTQQIGGLGVATF